MDIMYKGPAPELSPLRVKWRYLHHLNSKSKTWITKHGEYIGKIRHTVKHRGPQMACVHFDGNKHASIVPLVDLVFYDPREEK